MIAFWILAPIMVIAALGILFVRKAVHAALLLAVVMISLAVLYPCLDAPFLFAVQIIVYTGAILMLFLFVLMLVGVDASDSVVETIRGQRVLAAIGGLVLGLVLVIGVAQMSARLGRRPRRGQQRRQHRGPRQHPVLALRLRLRGHRALLITAAIGAMVLAHRERLTPKPTQAEHRRRSGCATTPSTASTSARCRLRVSSPGTTPSTPRRCCPTAPPPRRRSPGCSPPAARSARRRRWPTTSTRRQRHDADASTTARRRTR